MNVMDTILQVIDEKIRPQLRAHGGEIQVLDFTDGVLRFELLGQCAGCPSADLTSETIVKEELLAAVPEVQDAVLIQHVDDELYDFAKRILRGEKPE